MSKRWPKQLLVCGKSGSGKSLLVESILLQTKIYSKYTAIIDNGRSLEPFARSVAKDLKPLIVRPNGDSIFNYLDTQALPLTPAHLSDVTATISLMVGKLGDDERQHYREALISCYLEEFNRDCYRQWRTDHPEKFEEVVRHALCFETFPVDDSTSLGDRWVAYRHWQAEHHEEARERLAACTSEEIRAFDGNPDNEDLLYRLSFAFFAPDQYPTHSKFHDWLTLESLGNRVDVDEMQKLAALLQPWRSDRGRYGSLLDGVNNVNLSEDVVYIELGEIPESAPGLKAVVSFLVLNAIRNEITLRRPREQRKTVVIEELNSFLTMPGGEAILRDLFERSRKISTQCIAVTQETQSLASRGVSAAVFGNIRMAFLLKQTNPREIENLARTFNLPEIAQERLARFSEPSLNEGAPFLLVDNNQTPPVITEGRNFLIKFQEEAGNLTSVVA